MHRKTMCKIIIHKVVQRTMHRMTMCKIIIYKVVQRGDMKLSSAHDCANNIMHSN